MLIFSEQDRSSFVYNNQSRVQPFTAHKCNRNCLLFKHGSSLESRIYYVQNSRLLCGHTNVPHGRMPTGKSSDHDAIMQRTATKHFPSQLIGFLQQGGRTAF